MSKIRLLFIVLLVAQTALAQSFYNPLVIPPLLSGTNFQLDCDSGALQIYPGTTTRTFAINGDYLGPTLELQKGDSVQLVVNNLLGVTTSMHWHGLHVPAEMDGGPETTIPAGTAFTSSFRVLNPAATYWYHPHVHMKTMEQVTKGMAGVIIVRDSVESTLSLPRQYGLDDIPLVLQDRSYDAANQFQLAPLGDSMLVNGTAHPYLNIPEQVIRLRILNGSNTRVYNIGFNDNRTFQVIASDGGLLDSPVPVTRLRLSNGERAEILVSCNGQAGTSFRMKSYSTELPTTVPGNITGMLGHNGPLDATDFDIMEFNVIPSTPGGVTTIPSTLVPVITPDSSMADRVRYRTITGNGMSGGMGSFYMDGNQYIMGLVNDTMKLGDLELWYVTNTSNLAHPMHVHDVSFRILSRNGQVPPAVEQGWKDVFLIHPTETVALEMRFEDYANSTVPYMYHCHNLAHEDMGMMTSFIVVDTITSGTENIQSEVAPFSIYPNPATDRWRISSIHSFSSPLQITIRDYTGKTVNQIYTSDFMISTEGLQAGLYFITVKASGQKPVTLKGVVIGG